MIKATSIAQHRDAFDFKDVFLVDKEGKPNEELCQKFTSASTWYKAHTEESKKLFSEFDANRARRADMLDKVDAIAEKIFEKVNRTIDLYDPIPLMFPTRRTLERGQKLEIHDVYGGRVYERSYGGYVNASRLTQDVYTMSPKQFAIHIFEPLENLQSGRVTAADVSNAISMAVLVRRIRYAYDTYLAAYPAGGSYATNEGGPLEKSNLDALIDKVAMWSGANRVTVFGHYADIAQSNDLNLTANTANLFPESVKEDLFRRGVLTAYRGAMLQAIKHWVDDRYGFKAFPAGSIFAVSDANEEWNIWAEWPEITSSWFDESDQTMHWMYIFEIKAAVHKPKYGHRLYGITNSLGV